MRAFEPGVAIGDAPESDPRDGAAVLAENREQIGVTARQRLLHRVRQPACIRIEFGLGLDVELDVRRVLLRGHGKYVHIQLADVHFDAEILEGHDGGLLLLDGGPFHFVVPLEADGGHRDSGGLELFDQFHRAIPLGWVLHRIIVVVEFRLRVGLVSEFEGFGEVVFADNLQPGRLAQSAVFVQRLIDHIPPTDPALVSSHHGLYVIAHALEQGVAVQWLALVILEHPSRHLVVPHQRVANDEHVVLLAERHVAIRRVESIGIGAGMNGSAHAR